MGMPKYEIGPSAKTVDGVFVEASATRFTAEASGKQTVWTSSTIPLPPNRRGTADEQDKQVKYHQQQQQQQGRPSEGLGSGSYGGRHTPLGKMRPVSRARGDDCPSPIARSQSRQQSTGLAGRVGTPGVRLYALPGVVRVVTCGPHRHRLSSTEPCTVF
jgi:hypothetical protein